MSEFREFVKDGIRYRIEGDRVRVRKGMIWYDLAVYRERFGLDERPRSNVLPFKRREAR